MGLLALGESPISSPRRTEPAEEASRFENLIDYALSYFVKVQVYANVTDQQRFSRHCGTFLQATITVYRYNHPVFV